MYGSCNLLIVFDVARGQKKANQTKSFISFIFSTTFLVNMSVFLLSIVIIGYLLYRFHRDPPRIRKLGGNFEDLA
jgi:hypothetical protein